MPAQFLYPNVGALYLANLIATGPLIGASIRLFQNNIVPTTANVLADFTVANFSGYANLDIEEVPPAFIDPVLGGASVQISTQWSFTGGGTPVANTIYGFYIVIGTTDLFAVGTFDQPIPMSAIGDAIPLTVKLNYGSS